MFLPHLWLSEPFSTAPDESRVYSSYTSPSFLSLHALSLPPSVSHHYYSKSHRGTQGRNRLQYKRPFSASRLFLAHSLQSPAFSSLLCRVSSHSAIFSSTEHKHNNFWDVRRKPVKHLKTTGAHPIQANTELWGRLFSDDNSTASKNTRGCAGMSMLL